MIGKQTSKPSISCSWPLETMCYLLTKLEINGVLINWFSSDELDPDFGKDYSINWLICWLFVATNFYISSSVIKPGFEIGYAGILKNCFIWASLLRVKSQISKNLPNCSETLGLGVSTLFWMENFSFIA